MNNNINSIQYVDEGRGGRRGRDRGVVGFTTTSAITEVVSSNPVHGEVYSIQHYVLKFVSYL